MWFVEFIRTLVQKLFGAVDETRDANVFARMMYFECRGEPEQGQLAVAEVMANRMRDTRWPDTAIGVVSQSAQFTPWGRSDYFGVKVPKELSNAAQRVLDGHTVNGNDYFYFSVSPPRKYGQDMVKIGNHWFARDRRDEPKRPTLKRGDTGKHVITLQSMLLRLAYDINPDGIFGEQTEAQVKLFQEYEALDADGIVGTDTWNELDIQLVTNPTWVDRLIERGFEPMLLAKGLDHTIKQFQVAMTLYPDGVVGQKTLEALNSEIIVPRFPEDYLKCQCGQYCDGWPKGKGLTLGIRIAFERVFRIVEQRYPGTQFYIGTPAHPTRGGGTAGGGRCKTWNALRGGAGGSRHLQFDAMDPWGEDGKHPNSEIRDYLQEVTDQILKYGGVGKEGSHIVHGDTRPGRARWEY